MTTAADIILLLKVNDLAVERAITVLYQRQTQDERSHSMTKHSNGIGFKANHARLGSYYAKWIASGRHLTGSHIVNARKITLQYSRQLCEIAAEKLASQA